MRSRFLAALLVACCLLATKALAATDPQPLYARFTVIVQDPYNPDLLATP